MNIKRGIYLSKGGLDNVEQECVCVCVFYGGVFLERLCYHSEFSPGARQYNFIFVRLCQI